MIDSALLKESPFDLGSRVLESLKSLGVTDKVCDALTTSESTLAIENAWL